MVAVEEQRKKKPRPKEENMPREGTIGKER
jgi:hypothetical protein